jgi:hypothetical protein
MLSAFNHKLSVRGARTYLKSQIAIPPDEYRITQKARTDRGELPCNVAAYFRAFSQRRSPSFTILSMEFLKVAGFANQLNVRTH